MKCPNCDGKGVVHVRNIHAICGKCKGFGWIDEPQKKRQTNEEWLCGLSTEEKAEAIYECVMANSWNFSKDGIKRWLKQPHKPKE